PLSLNHYNVQPVFDVYAGVQGRHLGSLATDISAIIAKHQRQLSKASSIVVRGQVLSMNQSFLALALGIAFAVLFVYFLMVVNFQSWLDPLIILMALPGALAGILWMLFASGTTLSVPALMGAIMSIGVATSNSILLVTFANDQRREGKDATSSALAAAAARPRIARRDLRCDAPRPRSTQGNDRPCFRGDFFARALPRRVRASWASPPATPRSMRRSSAAARKSGSAPRSRSSVR